MYEITTVRTTVLAPGHEHIDLVGFVSPHLEQEALMITPSRVASRMALGDTFAIKIGDEMIEVKPAPCPVCAEAGHLKTGKDTKELQHLLALPQS